MPQGILVLVVFFLTILSIFVNRKVFSFKYSDYLDIPYYIAPLLGAFVIFALGGLTVSQVSQGIFGLTVFNGLNIVSSSGPFSTVILFLSIAFISLSLEVSGFFRFLAAKIIRMVDGSGFKLFFAVYWITGFLALFTSNDIIILTLTPFLIEFFRLLDIEAFPFLIAEFFAANIFSMVFLIGNETNIIVSTAYNIGFLQHPLYTFLPGIFGGIAAFFVLYHLFKDRIDVEYKVKKLPELKLNKWEVLSFSLLVSTLLSLAYLSLRGYKLWHVGILWVFITIYLFIIPDLIEKSDLNSLSKTYLYKINQKMPWEVIPFLLGFFLLVKALTVNGITLSITNILQSFIGGSLFSTVFGVGFISTFSANLLNNIPMTVLFSEVLSGYNSGATQLGAIYSLIIGSNIGANVTPIGALAGIMWMKMVNHERKIVGFGEFMRIGLKVTSVTALVCFVILYLEIISLGI